MKGSESLKRNASISTGQAGSIHTDEVWFKGETMMISATGVKLEVGDFHGRGRRDEQINKFGSTGNTRYKK
ncbi:MAG: hypothetical protein J0H07_10465 [Sphingobacteriales bacterium]|nr:hypothetical protein [Sphingobacteriales bacterium]